MPQFYPQRRRHGLKIESVQDETLVYDLDRHTAHCLKGEAAQVWREADGLASVPDIAARIGAKEEVVWRALTEIDAASLLETALPTEEISRSRRLLLLSLAAAVPLVLSVAVPAPAFAATA